MTARSTRRSFLAASGLVVVPALAGCGSSTTQRAGESLSGAGLVEQVPIKDRRRLPAISGVLLQGGSYDSRELLGKVVVYNVWGSWCVPCREEAPALARVSKQTRTQGVRFIGINVRDNDAAARAFEQRYAIEYPSINTASSPRALLAFGSKLPPSAVPSTMVVDRRGRLAARIIGKTSYATLLALIDDVLAESGQP